MFWMFIKKQLLLFWRNPQELLILLGMPLVLITILGVALGGFMSGDAEEIQITAAIVENGNEQEEYERFLQDLEKSNLPDEARAEVKKAAEQLLPLEMLETNILENKELKKYVTIEEKSPKEFAKLKEDDQYAAIIEVPEEFTYNILTSTFLQTTKAPQITLHLNEGKGVGAQIIEDIVTSFQEQYSLGTTIGQAAGTSFSDNLGEIENYGNMKTVNDRKPLTSIAYYTVGMSVMFVLYVASSIGSFAYREKDWHVFDRIMLANVPKWTYFISVITAAVLLALIQLGILFGLTSLFYGVRWPDIFSLMIVTFCLSIAVGSMAALVTSINYRVNSEAFSSFFSSITVTIFAFLGGSFFQVSEISKQLEWIGNLTPNGAGMTAYLKILQGHSIDDITPYLTNLLVASFILLLAAVLLFPRKGGAGI
jgi:ABC-2 type transport system permease protein